ncbi:hypothetical protein [Clostridium amylolyticum]|nr:hypothetical protein [Clostridium amylolyticum]
MKIIQGKNLEKGIEAPLPFVHENLYGQGKLEVVKMVTEDLKKLIEE